LPARRTLGTTEERQADQARLAAEREARRKSGKIKPEDRSDTPCAASCGKSAGLAHAPVAGELVGRLLAPARPADLGRRCSAVRGGWDLSKVQAGMAAVQLFVDELDDDLVHELGDGAAQLVTDERLERLGRRGHGLSLRPLLVSVASMTPPPRRAKTPSIVAKTSGAA
jgi:hypothetical protein